MAISSFIPNLTRDAAAHRAATGRPLVTLSYAQSVDGSLSHSRGQPLALSGPESLNITHRLRDAHDAILVGIGTVLADDPRLTVRSVAGKDPQPVVLDSRLRLPSGARLWSHPRPPWIFCGVGADPARRVAADERGGSVFETPASSGRYLDLAAVLDRLATLGVESLMVEGGAAVITSFLAGGLVDRAVVTIAPVYVGGLRLLEERLEPMPTLRDVESFQVGRDVLILGSFGPRV